jgi:N-acetylglucosamine-6-phosphate deacetylase
VISSLTERGVVVSEGHSMATYTEAKAGIEAGARYATHLFNAMPPLNHREPGLIGAVMEDDRMIIGLIVDGEHVHRSVVRMIWQALGGVRLNLVTDAMAALGMPPGVYHLGDFDVKVDESTARLADGTLAGSILAMDQALRNLLEFIGCSLQEVLPSLTSTPARMLGLDGRKGHIAAGYDADLVLLDSDLKVVSTFVGGQRVYSL